MSDQEFYKLINTAIFKNGSCKPNIWFNVIIKEENIHCEAILPSKGNLKIRKPVKQSHFNGYEEMIYEYNLYRFTNKKELIYEGRCKGLKSEVNEIE